MTKLFLVTPTGMYRRSLRRFAGIKAPACTSKRGYHEAEVVIGDVHEHEREVIHGDNWSHDDERWPKQCDCGYVFQESDHWQRNDTPLYGAEGHEPFVLMKAPVGAMWHAPWMANSDCYVVSIPGGSWDTSLSKWTVTGEPPLITVSPSIWYNPPHGWHGFIREGVLIDA